MDELIDRARRGEATEAELGELAAWRSESAENERRSQERTAASWGRISRPNQATTRARPSDTIPPVAGFS